MAPIILLTRVFACNRILKQSLIYSFKYPVCDSCMGDKKMVAASPIDSFKYNEQQQCNEGLAPIKAAAAISSSFSSLATRSSKAGGA